MTDAQLCEQLAARLLSSSTCLGVERDLFTVTADKSAKLEVGNGTFWFRTMVNGNVLVPIIVTS